MMRSAWLRGFFGLWLGLTGVALACDETERLAELRAAVGQVTVDGEGVSVGRSLCPGEYLQTGAGARATVWLIATRTTVRLKANSQMQLPAAQADPWYLRLFDGVMYLFSRVPQRLEVKTRLLNGGIEGTEFLIQASRRQSRIDVIEGRVLASNDQGQLRLAQGEAAVAGPGEPPTRGISVATREAVNWTIYYPPVITPASPWADDPALVRASRLLAAGEVQVARAALEEAATDGGAATLQTIITVAQGQREAALEWARQAVAAAPQAVAPKLALSYAQQAQLDLDAAVATMREAVAAVPQHALARARLAELELALGRHSTARRQAQRAAALAPNLALTHIVRGFAALAQFRAATAEQAFERALARDGQHPQAWLGLGLARINQGQLAAGRQALEIAVAHAPASALIRSYLGKAYFEARQHALAAVQLALAKELDPQDPTAWYYDALRLQTENRPVAALQDLQAAIAKNDNRAVYRSQHHLDSDEAARSASLGRVYQDLGFNELASRQAYRALSHDPFNHVSHRLLADALGGEPRQELARVSELFQAQLWQPMNINPIPPHLLESDLQVLAGAGPTTTSQYEFNPLFARDRLAAQVAGLVGNQQTLADDALLTGQYGPIGVTLGQYHYETEGFRDNNDQTQDLYSAFVQTAPLPQVNLQFEARRRVLAQGDLIMRYEPNAFQAGRRQRLDDNRYRIGARLTPGPHTTVLASGVYNEIREDSGDTEVGIASDRDKYTRTGEVALAQQFGRHSLMLGMGYSISDKQGLMQFTRARIPSRTIDLQERRRDVFGYLYLNPHSDISLTLGLGRLYYDSQEVGLPNFDIVRFAPKFGLVWDVTAATTVRLAAFSELKRPLDILSIEPTQVAGFGQIFDDANGAKSNNVGLGIDAQPAKHVFAGIEYRYRNLNNPAVSPIEMSFNQRIEHRGTLYLDWTPTSSLAIGVEPRLEHFNRKDTARNDYLYAGVTNYRLPVTVRWFMASSLAFSIEPTFVMQKLESAIPENYASQDNGFSVFDAALTYRLPQRLGRIHLAVQNMLDSRFNYHGYSLFNPSRVATPEFLPERTYSLSVVLAFY